MMAELQFLRPAWLLALLALPLLWWALRAERGNQRGWARAVDAHLLPYLLAGAESRRRWPRVLALLAWSIASVALAGPAWERLPTPLYRNQAARVVALQLSPSMLAGDLKPNRLVRARFAVSDLLDLFADGQVALLGYAGDAFVVAPMTDDSATVRNLLGELEPSVMPVAGNATAAAIRRGVELIRQSGAAAGDIVLVLDSASADAAAAAREAAGQGVRVSVLAVGTAAGAPVSLPQGDFWKDSDGNIVVPRLESGPLRALAQAGGGSYVELGAAGNADLSALAGHAAASRGDAAQPGVDSAQLRDRGPWLALLLVPLALAGFRRGGLAALLLVAGLGAHRPAQAFEWRDLWQRADQQAWQDLQAGEAEAAAGKARDADLRGAARFRAGDAAGAAQDWSAGSSADTAYNRGNALARQQQYEQALAAWDEALRRDPQHADAAANKQILQDWLREQQKSRSAQDKSSASKDQQSPSGAKPDQPGQGGQDASGAAQQSQDASAGEDGQQEDGQAGQQGEAAQNGQPGARSEGEDRSGSAGESQQGQDQASRQGQAKPGEDNDPNASKDATGQAKPDAQQQQAYQQAMQQALSQQQAQQQAGEPAQQAQAAQGKPGDKTDAKPQGSQALPAETTEQREQRQSVEQWLQRVPDDPGGLLRRKFQLEHERRQRAGSGDR